MTLRRGISTLLYSSSFIVTQIDNSISRRFITFYVNKNPSILNQLFRFVLTWKWIKTSTLIVRRHDPDSDLTLLNFMPMKSAKIIPIISSPVMTLQKNQLINGQCVLVYKVLSTVLHKVLLGVCLCQLTCSMQGRAWFRNM